MSPYFDYKLTAFPTSLLKDNFMHKSVKAQLAKSLMDSMDSSEHRRQVMHVLDEGALLHRERKCYNTKRIQSSMCPMYEENMEKVVLLLTVMSRDH